MQNACIFTLVYCYQLINIMGNAPKTIEADALAVEALEKMRQHNINQLIAIDQGKYAGILHLQDLVREGII
jgi:arabinose-5-phosphate isomerase